MCFKHAVHRLSMFLLCALTSVLLVSCMTSCSTVPPELVEANRMQSRAIAAAQQNQIIVVDAYSAELLRVKEAQITAIMDAKLAESRLIGTNGDAVVPETLVQQLLAAQATALNKIRTDIAALRTRFLSNRELDIAMRLNSKVGEWLHVYVEEFAQRAQELVNLGGDLYGGATGDEVPDLNFLNGGAAK